MSAPLRVAIFGPESTGKSTLAAWLAKEFDEPWAPEYVREFWDTHDARIVADDLDAIARGQIASEEQAAAQARRVLFADTDLLTNVLWADLLFPGHCPPWVRSFAEQRCRQYALYLLCDIDVPFEPDPQRSFPDEADRVRLRDLWHRTLVERKLPFIWIRGDTGMRCATARVEVESLLGKK